MPSLLHVVDQLPAAVVVTTTGDHVVAASPAARAILELNLDEFDGITLEERLASLKLPPSLPRAQIESDGVAYLVVGLEDATWTPAPADVTALAREVAHDFNNLLGVIINFTTIAAAELSAGSAARSDLREVLQAANRAATLTQRLQLLGHDAADVPMGDS